MDSFPELPNMFWGLILKPEKRYEQTVETPFHVSKACVEPATMKGGFTSIFVEVENEEYLVANLSEKCVNESLNLNFNTGDKICFKVSGPGVVHLTGYNVLEEDEDMFEDMSDESGEEEESEEEGIPMLTNGKSLKRKNEATGESPAKKKEKKDLTNGIPSAKEEKKKALEMRKKIAETAKKVDQSDEDSDEDDESGEEEEDQDLDESEDNVESSDDDEESEEISSDENEEMETDNSPAKKKKGMNGVSSPKNEVKTPVKKTPSKGEDKKTPGKKEEKKTPAKGEQKKEQTPEKAKMNGAQTEESAKKKKKKNKEKQENGDPQGDPKQTPQKQEPPKQTPGKTPKRTLKGGIVCEDLKIGNGPEAKRGKMVGMYYEGKLKSNGKKFDATLSGKPFRFRLGVGEVIKGWDVGVDGMKVGGKRRLTIPPQMAYGPAGVSPDIPPNSHLLFEVECKAVN